MPDVGVSVQTICLCDSYLTAAPSVIECECGVFGKCMNGFLDIHLLEAYLQNKLM